MAPAFRSACFRTRSMRHAVHATRSQPWPTFAGAPSFRQSPMVAVLTPKKRARSPCVSANQTSRLDAGAGGAAPSRATGLLTAFLALLRRLVGREVRFLIKLCHSGQGAAPQ